MAGMAGMAGPPATGAVTPVGAEPAVDGVPATKPAAGAVAGPPGPGWVGAEVFGGTVTTPDPREPAAPITLGGAEGTGPLHTCNPAPRTTARPHEARKARAPTAVHTVVGTARHRAIVRILSRQPPEYLRSTHFVRPPPLYGVYSHGNSEWPYPPMPDIWDFCRAFGWLPRAAGQRPPKAVASGVR
jgi:hypothetical protein